MAVVYTIDPETGIVRLTTTGVSDARESLEVFTRVLSDPTVPRPLRVLDDRRGVSADVSNEAVRTAVQAVQRFAGQVAGVRVAVLAGQDTTFGLARMFQLSAGDLPMGFRVFRGESDAEAVAWLLGEGA